jgi:hypothetical protein
MSSSRRSSYSLLSAFLNGTNNKLNEHIEGTPRIEVKIDRQYIASLRTFVIAKYQQNKSATVSATSKATYDDLHFAIPFQLTTFRYFYDMGNGVSHHAAVASYIEFMHQYNLAYLQLLEAIDGPELAVAQLKHFFKPGVMFAAANVDPLHVSEVIKKPGFLPAMFGYMLLDVVFSQNNNIPVDSRLKALTLAKTHFGVDNIAQAFGEFRKGYEKIDGTITNHEAISKKVKEIFMVPTIDYFKRQLAKIAEDVARHAQEVDTVLAKHLDASNKRESVEVSIVPSTDQAVEVSIKPKAVLRTAEFKWRAIAAEIEAEKAFVDKIFKLIQENATEPFADIKTIIQGSLKDYAKGNATTIEMKKLLNRLDSESVHDFEEGTKILIANFPEHTVEITLAMLQMNDWTYDVTIDKAAILKHFISLVDEHNAEQILGEDASYRKTDVIVCSPELKAWAIKQIDVVNIENYVDLNELAALPDEKSRLIFLNMARKIYDLEKELVAVNSTVIEKLLIFETKDPKLALRICDDVQTADYPEMLRRHYRVLTAQLDKENLNHSAELSMLTNAYDELKKGQFDAEHTNGNDYHQNGPRDSDHHHTNGHHANGYARRS